MVNNRRTPTIGCLGIIFCCFSISCETPEGKHGASDNIEDAKRRGVFIKEYTVFPNPYRINDTLQITVKEAWLETQWIHTSTREGTVPKPGIYQLNINTTEKDIDGASLDWRIGVNDTFYLRPSSINSLVGDFYNIPGDTIVCPVERDNAFMGDTTGRIIGKFVLIKR